LKQFLKYFDAFTDVAILDESTSALSLDAEEFVYRRCVDLGMTLISVGHRKSLKKFHQSILQLGVEKNGEWKLTQLSKK
jgi:ABC-type uncharacterized transport system fused permease/ATPase subunit